MLIRYLGTCPRICPNSFLESAVKGRNGTIAVASFEVMKRKIAIITASVLLAALAEYAMGRRIWGVGGTPGVWSGDIWSSHNSQFLLDPYTFTHISHGILFYGILTLAFRTLPV